MDCDTLPSSGLLDYNYADESRTEHATKRTFHAVWRSKQPPRMPPRDSFGTRDVSQSPAKAVSFRADTSLSSSYNESCCISYYDQCFETIKKIGEGSFGEVFKVKSKDDGKLYAVKKTKVMFAHKWDRMHKIEEVRRHETIPRHANCVEMIFSWEEYEYLYIQLELCETSLEDFTRAHVLPESSVWLVTLDLLMAVQHIHRLNIVHLDIKLENILISPLGRCKLGDFGIAVDITQGNLSDSLDGDAKYLAPEVLENRFSKAADVFSLGVVTLEVATDLVIPRRGPLWHQLRADIMPPPAFMAGLSSEMIKLVTCMMTSDPERRPSVDQILSTPRLVTLRSAVTPATANTTITQLLDTETHRYPTPPPHSPDQRCTPPCPHSRILCPAPHTATRGPPSIHRLHGPRFTFSDDDDDDEDLHALSDQDPRNSSMKDDVRRLTAPGGRDPDYYNFVSRQSPRISPIHFMRDAMDTTELDTTEHNTTPRQDGTVNSTPQRGKMAEALNARRLRFN